MVTPSNSAKTVAQGEAASDVHSIPRVEGEDPLIGRILDERYRIEGVLGSGGVGVVYRGRHLGLNRLVAIKVLRDGYLDVEVLRKRFEREAQALSALAHPNIVGLTDYGISDGMPYLVMELLDGSSLDELIDERTRMEPRRVVEIVRGVVRALAFAHQRGVLHRDLKPGNVILAPLPDEPDHVKLLDFGLAKILEDEADSEEPTLTRAGTIIGTPAYMAPEQASGSRADERADVYSAGILLYELLAGRPPFKAEKRTDVMRSHIIDPVPDPSTFRPALAMTSQLEEVLVRCLAKEPGQRYSDGSELLQALEQLPEPAARYEETKPPKANKDVAIRTLEERSSSMTTSTNAGDVERAPGWIRAALVVIAVGAIGAVWALWPTSTPTAASPRGESNEAQHGSPPTSPFAAPLPPELADLEAQLVESEARDRGAHQRTRRYQRRHPEDPRPSLLLAHDFANRGQWTAAIERYANAISRSPTAKQDPRMLEDLLRAAQMPAAADDAIGLLQTEFGDEALMQLDELLDRAENPTRRERLQRLGERLRTKRSSPSSP